MKIAVAVDSMKGSLTSLEAGEAVKEGILKADPSAEVKVFPLADGGEGTQEALTKGLGGKEMRCRVKGPMGRPVDAVYGMAEEKKLAVLEMASAAGITLVSPEERDPLHAATYGVGELIRDAVKRGCRQFIIGIGGSATTDGGLGMLQALGYEFLDEEGNPVPADPSGMDRIAAIRSDHVLPELKECSFQAACDVTNPLCGPNGAVRVFGGQKGIREKEMEQWDSRIARYASVCEAFTGRSSRELPGAGAAGGLGFALLNFLQAELKPGAELVLETVRLEEELRDCDLVITGEGRLDGQTVMGKAPIRTAQLAKRWGIPVAAVAGAAGPEAVRCNEAGIDAFFPIPSAPLSLEEAMEKETARKNLSLTAEQIIRLLQAFQSGGRRK